MDFFNGVNIETRRPLLAVCAHPRATAGLIARCRDVDSL
jgi:hypothetical protein